MTVEHPNHENIGASFSTPVSGFGQTGLHSPEDTDTLPQGLHAPHPGCLVTTSFRSSADIASLAIVVVNEEGFFVYSNAAAADLFGFPAAELCSKHIFDVTVAESSLIAEEFGWLQANQRWSGQVVIRHSSGKHARVGVNAFRSHLAGDEPEYMALLHATSLDGPAVARIAEPETSLQLTMRDIRLLHLIAEGFADKEIASLLSTSVWTINRDVSEMLSRLDVMSRTEACVKAIRTGMIA